jgi:hypothetical protein
MLRLQRFVRSSMWLLPMACLIAGALLVLGTLAVDRATDYGLVHHSVTGTPSDAQTILSSFATALVSLTTLVLTVTLVAVQLASDSRVQQPELAVQRSLPVGRCDGLQIGQGGARLPGHRAASSHEDEEDVVAALTPDTEGIGSGADVTATPDLGRVLGLLG